MARIRNPRIVYSTPPDEIGPSSDLKPAARVVGAPFQTAPEPETLRQVPTNSMAQLANALSTIQPTLSRVAGFGAELSLAKTTESAEADFIKNNQMGFLEAQKAGNIPAGANPYYVEHYKQLELRTKATQAKGQMYSDYINNGELRNSDKPGAFDSWANQWAADFRQGSLMDAEGNQRYTSREIVGSKYDTELRNSLLELRNTHIQHRAAVRTKEGEDAYVNHLSVQMKQLANAKDGQRDYASMGKQINEELMNPTVGFAVRGLDKSKANQLIVDSVTAGAIAAGDMELLNVLDHIPTNNGANKLGQAKYAIEKRSAAEEHITSQIIRNDTWEWNKRTRAAGLTPEEAGERARAQAEREKVVWGREDQRFATEEQKAGQAEYKYQLGRQTENHLTRIFVGMNDAKSPDDPRVKKSMDWLSYNDPEKYMEMTRFIDSFARDKAKFIETKESQDTAARLRSHMSQDANSFDSSKIIQAYNRGLLSPENLQKLFDDWDKMKNHRDHPFIQDGRFNELAGAARRAVQKDADDQYGPGAMRGEAAVMDLRAYAYKWIKDNPQGKQTEFDKAMVDYLDPILQKRAEEFGKEQEKAKQKRENPPPLPVPDTRSTYEKVAPEVLGGEKKPQPQPQAPKKPAPFDQDVRETINQGIGEVLSVEYATPQELEFALISKVWPLYKANGRNVVDFLEDMKPLVGKHGTKKPSTTKKK